MKTSPRILLKSFIQHSWFALGKPAGSRRNPGGHRPVWPWVTLLVWALAQGAWAAAPAPRFKLDTSPLPAEARPTLSFHGVVERVAPSVVNIYSTKTVRQEPFWAPFLEDPFFRRFFDFPDQGPRERRERSLGSGVIVTEDGYILTSHHVVAGAEEIRVALADGKTEYEARLVGSDPRTDVAVIKVEARNLPAIVITDSDQLRVGDIVLAIGNPFGVGQTVTMGIVSAKSRSGLGLDYEDFIQTDAAINPGNSGGALVDASGRLVGINTAIITRTGGNLGIGFAIPANLARYVMERLISDGKVTRGYLGLSLQPLTRELAREFQLSEPSGALVAEVVPDSPAAEAGLKEGDVIVEFNNRKVEDMRHLRLMAAQTPPGTTVPVKVLRDGKELTLKVTLGEFPEEGGLARAGRPGGLRRGDRSAADLLDGVVVDDLTPRNRQQFNIPSQVRGALVVEVDPDSLAGQQGLQPGDVILEINRQRVTSADQAVRISQNLRGDRVLLRVWSNGASRFLVIDATRRR
ncbi:MAG: DegQ family serine endoprotease [Limisphaera sp.]|nr:DegQ family serine endoprotease [Limisphaera sp.]